jgi:CheY-like chemotaxis protein
MQLFVMTTVFRVHGYHVTTAQNGFEAFEMIQAIVKQEGISLSDINKRMFCLVLLDLNMPISDGFETCTNISSLYNCKNVFNMKNRS